MDSWLFGQQLAANCSGFLDCNLWSSDTPISSVTFFLRISNSLVLVAWPNLKPSPQSQSKFVPSLYATYTSPPLQGCMHTNTSSYLSFPNGKPFIQLMKISFTGNSQRDFRLEAERAVLDSNNYWGFLFCFLHSRLIYLVVSHFKHSQPFPEDALAWSQICGSSDRKLIMSVWNKSNKHLHLAAMWEFSIYL